MKRKLFLLILLTILVTGCAGIPYYYTLGSEGYNSPEGQAARTAITETATPIVGENLAAIIGSLAGLLAGGYAVHKRRKYLDTPTS